MPVDRFSVIHHLLRWRLLDPEALMRGDVMVVEHAERNHLLRIVRDQGPSYLVKQPLAAEADRQLTVWMEATFYWLVQHDPTFATLSEHVPTWRHFDQRNHVLVLDLVSGARSLQQWVAESGPGRLPEMARRQARILSILHGEVSEHARAGRARELFRTEAPWILGIADHAHSAFARRPATADQALAQHVLALPALAAALRELRATWAPTHLIHGDVKWTNFLIADDVAKDGRAPTDRLLLADWELAALGDPLCDVGGALASVVLHAMGEIAAAHGAGTARMHAADLPRLAVEHAAPVAATLWNEYAELRRLRGRPGDTLVRRAALHASARLVQSCFEHASYLGTVGQSELALLYAAAAVAREPGMLLRRPGRAAGVPARPPHQLRAQWIPPMVGAMERNPV